jgi:hypothetical protein
LSCQVRLLTGASEGEGQGGGRGTRRGTGRGTGRGRGRGTGRGRGREKGEGEEERGRGRGRGRGRERERYLEEAADVVVDGPAPEDRLDDRREVVVHDDDVRRLLYTYRNISRILICCIRDSREIVVQDGHVRRPVPPVVRGDGGNGHRQVTRQMDQEWRMRRRPAAKSHGFAVQGQAHIAPVSQTRTRVCARARNTHTTGARAHTRTCAHAHTRVRTHTHTPGRRRCR